MNGQPQQTLETIRRAQQNGDLKVARDALEALLSQEISRDPAFKALRALVLIQNGDPKGKEILEEAAREKPDTSAWAGDLGLGFFLTGKMDRAREVLELTVRLPRPDAAAFNRLATVLMAKGDLEGAEKAFQEAVLRDPEKAELHNNLGAVKVQLGKLEEALGHYERSLRLKPDLAAPSSARGRILVALERADEAIAEIETRLDKHPDPPEAVHIRRHLAHILAVSDRFEEACARLREASELDPENVDVLLQWATLLFSRARLGPALVLLNKAHQLQPESLPALGLTARVLSEMGRHRKAAETVEKCFAAHLDAPACLLTRAAVRSAADDYGGAEEDLRRVLEVLPGSAEAWGSLGHILLLTGRIDEAVECFSRAAELNPAALASLIEARPFPEDPQVIDRMMRFAENPLHPKEPRAAMAFALTKLCEKKKQYDLAFRHADHANALVKKTISYTPERYSRLVRQLKEIFIPEFFSKFTGAGSPSERPVFVVGMPRSGTTLTEQVLASHPRVFGAGELGFITSLTRLMPAVLKTRNPYPLCMHLFQRWMAMHGASYYLTKIASLDQQAARVVDKMPHNFLHLGLMAVIFPRARIIHVRRDIRDIAVSNYFTNFKSKHGGLGYAFDLCHIGFMLNDYQVIMEHWSKVLPVPVFDLEYEELVDEPEATCRKLLDFVGLEWDDRVLDFHRTERVVKTASVWQVRQPLYRSSRERWRRYEEFLGPLMEVLRP